jgi:hypothetical protein
MNALLVTNSVVAAVSIGFGGVGAVRPTVLTEGGTPSASERFYGWMYAARAIPLGCAAGFLPFVCSGAACAGMLFAAAAAQLGDAAIGMTRKRWSMIAGGVVAAAIHTLTAFSVG